MNREDISTLRTLAIALVRSKLTYAQEFFFSAPKSELKKLQSIYCRAFKLASGVPFHTNNLNTYNEIKILPLDFNRQAQASKFIIKTKSFNTSCISEINITSNKSFAKRGINIHSITPIRSFTNLIFHQLGFDEIEVSTNNFIPTIPYWSLLKPKYDLNYEELNKSIPPYLLKTKVLEHIYNKYNNHIKIYTDGSKLDNEQTGAAYYNQTYRQAKSFYIGKFYSIFTAELVGIQQATNHIITNNITNQDILFCIDSKSVITSLQSNNNKNRPSLIYQIQLAFHNILSNNKSLSILWTPSHCDISGNEIADKEAKKGATNSITSSKINIALDSHEHFYLINKTISNNVLNLHKTLNNSYSKTCVLYTKSLNPTKSK